MTIIPTLQEIAEGPQSVSFQIVDGKKRRDCILKTTFPNKSQASKYLITHRSAIERLARDAMAIGKIKDGQVRLVMI
jgi:hypothetical protein